MPFRPALAALLSALLSACVAAPERPDASAFTLDGRGIAPTVSGLRIDFGRAQVGVIDTVSRLLDAPPVAVAIDPECGAAPVTTAAWADGLTLTFLDGTFAGWTSSDPGLRVAGGFVAGQLRLGMPPVSFQVTALGTEFNRGDIFGRLDGTDTRVSLLGAGMTCIFR